MVTKLVVASGKSAGRTISIKRNKLLIGRAEECDVRPLSEEVSRRHCVVIVGPADAWIEDLGSRNGTFVNGTRITEKTKLADGDMIRVGSLELTVSQQRQAAAREDDDVSRLLMTDERAPGLSDTTRSVATARPEAPDSSDSSFVGGMADSPAESTDETTRSSATISLRDLKSAREKPGSLPQQSAKKADSSRDAAAEALKKFFERK
jgi:pSer/pThr/pTyr-binding forkhead associated (FHA) protein